MIFRAYDIRGVVGDTLTEPLAERIGLAFGSEMRARGASQVIIGRDNRHSSAGLVAALGAGVRASGLKTLDIGMVATPIVYHASITRGDAPAVMVTGSHLPPDHNGFKLTQGVSPFFGDDIQRLRQRIEAEDFQRGYGEAAVDEHAASRYMADLAGRFHDAEKPLTVVVDAGNGTAGLFAPTLFRYMRHRVIALYCEPDGDYPNHPADPFEPDNLLDAKGLVITQGADLGLAFDGDADRLGMIDAQGRSHSTDRLMIPLVWDVLKRHPGATIITDPLVSQVLIDMIKAAGGVPLMWRSGHSFIKAKMKETGAPLGIETSGHVFIAGEYYGYDDGIYVGMRLVELLSRRGTAPLHEIMAKVPQLYTTPQFRPACPEPKKAAVIEALGRAYAEHEINTVDGVRVTTPAGWFICRASNTEPKLSLRFEARDEDALEGLVGGVARVLAEQDIILQA